MPLASPGCAAVGTFSDSGAVRTVPGDDEISTTTDHQEMTTMMGGVLGVLGIWEGCRAMRDR